MDSSRSSPLTTFIMMLPLIVVPAIAMLKPADQAGGLVSDILSAATGSDPGEASNDGGEASEFTEAGDDFSSIFEEIDADTPPQAEPNAPAESSDTLFQEALGNGDALVDDFATTVQPSATRRTPPTISAELNSDRPPTDTATAQLLEKLKRMGASRTLWFSPGNQSVGFVAFFRPSQGVVSYRFEAIAGSRAAAVQDVMQQAAIWQGNQRQ